MIDWQRIRNVSDPTEQLVCLRWQLTMLAAESLDADNVELPVRATVSFLDELADVLQTASPTPEALLLPRSEFGEAVELVMLLLFRKCGLIKLEEPRESTVCGHQILRTKCDDDTWSEWRLVRRLLIHTSMWLGRSYILRILRRHLQHLPWQEQNRYREIRDRLAAILSRSASEPIQDKLSDPSGVPQQHVDELRKLRMLAWTHSTHATSSVVDDRNEVQAGEDAPPALVAVVPIRSRHIDVPTPGYGLITFCRDRIVLWTSFEWSVALEEMDRSIKHDGADAQWAHLEDLFRIGNDNAEGTLAGIALQQELAVAALSDVRLLDLSGLNLPWTGLLDPAADSSVTCGASFDRSAAARDKASTIHFWGAYDEPDNERLTVDHTARTLRYTNPRRNAQYEWRFPDHPVATLKAPPVSFLPGAFYDRWILEDLCAETGVELAFHCNGRSGTREAFLRSEFPSHSVLHFSTHGMAYAAAPEFANLQLCQGEDGDNQRIHLLDVLSMDLTGVKLVFLQACLTKAGRPFMSDEDLSLAWAFTAAGAHAVIATHWSIPDASAWEFTRAFYTHWLQNQCSIAEAFRRARGELRSKSQFDSPRHWAGYSLVVSERHP